MPQNHLHDQAAGSGSPRTTLLLLLLLLRRCRRRHQPTPLLDLLDHRRIRIFEIEAIVESETAFGQPDLTNEK